MQPCRHARVEPVPSLKLQLSSIVEPQVSQEKKALAHFNWTSACCLEVKPLCFAQFMELQQRTKVAHQLTDEKRAEQLHADPKKHLLHEKLHPECDLLQAKTAALKRLSDIESNTGMNTQQQAS